MKYSDGPLDLPFLSKIQRFSGITAAVILLMSTSVLTGWAFNIAFLKSIIPGGATMKPLMAVAFLLAGAALWLLREQSTTPWRYRMGLLCAGGTTVIGAVVLGEYTFNTSLGIDHPLFKEAVMAEPELHTGRPKPSSAFCLLMSGAALLLLDARQRRWVPILALFSLVGGLLGVFGHAYGVSVLYWMAPYPPMTLYTSVLLIILNLGILAARPDHPFMTGLSGQSPGSQMARRLLPMIVLLPFVIGWLRLIGQQRGWYGTEFGTALVVTLTIVLFAALVYWTAHLLNRSEDEKVANLIAARDSDERLRLAWLATRDVIWDWDIVHDVQRWSEVGFDVFGWREVVDAVQPLSWWAERVHAEDRARVTADFHAVLADPGRNHWQDEYRFLKADGSYADVLDRGFVIRDSRGKPLRMIGAMQDITERKQAEEAMARQRRLYEGVLRTTPDLAYIFDLNHRFIYANEGLLKMWGKSWTEAMGKNCLELGYEPWHAAMHDREIEQVIATKKPIRGEVPFSGTFGRRIYDYIFTPVLGADGEVEAIAGTTRDVTDIRAAEEALRESEDRLRFALEASHTGAWDLDLVEQTAHRSLEHDRIFGYDQLLPEWSRDMFFEHVLPEDRLAVEATFRRAKAKQCDLNFECRIRRADGEVRWIWAAGRHREDHSGQPHHMVGIVLDITARKQAEEELLRLNTELEQRVQERTAQLLSSKEHLQISLQEKEVLLKEIHHRVKNNLQIIASLLKMQSDSQPDTHVRELFQESQSRIRSMALIHEQLYKTKDLKTINFANYVAQLINHIHRSFARPVSRVTVRLDIPPFILDIDYALPLGLIVNELVSNSFKYAFPNLSVSERGEIWVIMAQEGADGLTLEVGDSGCGLPNELDLEQSPSMGLQLVRSLVVQLHGRLTVERHSGARFRIFLPTEKICLAKVEEFE
jgi:PAS domain S-box-containing protein